MRAVPSDMPEGEQYLWYGSTLVEIFTPTQIPGLVDAVRSLYPRNAPGTFPRKREELLRWLEETNRGAGSWIRSPTFVANRKPGDIEVIEASLPLHVDRVRISFYAASPHVLIAVANFVLDERRRYVLENQLRKSFLGGNNPHDEREHHFLNQSKLAQIRSDQRSYLEEWCGRHLPGWFGHFEKRQFKNVTDFIYTKEIEPFVHLDKDEFSWTRAIDTSNLEVWKEENVPGIKLSSSDFPSTYEHSLPNLTVMSRQSDVTDVFNGNGSLHPLEFADRIPRYVMGTLILYAISELSVLYKTYLLELTNRVKTTRNELESLRYVRDESLIAISDISAFCVGLEGLPHDKLPYNRYLSGFSQPNAAWFCAAHPNVPEFYQVLNDVLGRAQIDFLEELQKLIGLLDRTLMMSSQFVEAEANLTIQGTVKELTEKAVWIAKLALAVSVLAGLTGLISLIATLVG